LTDLDEVVLGGGVAGGEPGGGGGAALAAIREAHTDLSMAAAPPLGQRRPNLSSTQRSFARRSPSVLGVL
jgi:hypothetical protein